MSRFQTKKIIKDVEPIDKTKLRFAVGLDLSFNSPGCTIIDLQKDRYYHGAFTQKAREDVNFYYATSNAEVWLFDALPETHYDVLKYIHVEKLLMAFLIQHIPMEFRAHHTDVRIEQYAFADPSESGNNYKLHENGGIMKRGLYLNGFLHVLPVVNTAWKRTVIGKGDATKLEVIDFIATHGPRINFLTILGYDDKTLAKDAKGRAIVPPPAQDLADSCAVALEVITIRKKKDKQLFEIETTKLPEAPRAKGKALKIRQVKTRKRKPPIVMQPTFLEPTQESKISFWVIQKKTLHEKKGVKP